MSLLQSGLTAIIRVYQIAISPVLGQRCRFHPSCSSFMAEAIASHGAGRGIWLGMTRLVRCHPWAVGGHDPVPHNHQAGECASLQNAKAEQ